MDKKKTTITTILTTLGILTIIIIISYAYFVLDKSLGNIKNLSVESGSLDTLFFTEGEASSLIMSQFNLAEGMGKVESESITSATLVLGAGNTTASANYFVYYYIESNSYNYSDTVNETPEIILTITDSNGDIVSEVDGLTYVEVDDVKGFDITTQTGYFRIAENQLIETDDVTVHDWKFKLTIMNLDVSQTDNLDKKLVSYAILNNAYLSSSSYIFEKLNVTVEEIEAKEEPDFGSDGITNEGLYSTEDDYGTSYYFRGDVNDNWVIWAGFYWRIIRIDGNGDAKLIYTGAVSDSQEDLESGASSSIGFDVYNGVEYAMYAGYQYNTTELHAYGDDTTDSTMKIIIDEWYENNLLDTAYEDDIVDAVYCNDRSSYNSGNTYVDLEPSSSYISFGARVRLNISKSPTLICPSTADAFTVSDTINGNGALDYPIGLITADEASFAGLVYYGINSEASNNYLIAEDNYWTMSPGIYNATFYAYSVGIRPANSIAGIVGILANNVYGIRPVVTVSLSTTSILGEGTLEDPYKIT